jgi:hypothetical protein
MTRRRRPGCCQRWSRRFGCLRPRKGKRFRRRERKELKRKMRKGKGDKTLWRADLSCRQAQGPRQQRARTRGFETQGGRVRRRASPKGSLCTQREANRTMPCSYSEGQLRIVSISTMLGYDQTLQHFQHSCILLDKVVHPQNNDSSSIKHGRQPVCSGYPQELAKDKKALQVSSSSSHGLGVSFRDSIEGPLHTAANSEFLTHCARAKMQRSVGGTQRAAGRNEQYDNERYTGPRVLEWSSCHLLAFSLQPKVSSCKCHIHSRT